MCFISTTLSCIAYNITFGVLPQTSINKLQRIQNTAAQIVTRTSRRSHITPILTICIGCLLSIECNLKSWCIRIKPYINRLQDTYLICWQFINQEEHNVRWVQWHRWFQGLEHLASYGERKFQCSTAKLWNTFPANIRESKTLNILKMLLKTHLFTSYFDV